MGASRSRCRTGQCFQGKHTENFHPVAARLSDEKKESSSRGPFRYYVKLAQLGEERLPQATKYQIHIDVERTFTSLPEVVPSKHWGWPPSMPFEERKARLSRVLLALEYRNQCILREQGGLAQVPKDSPERGTTYVQGCSLLAAMCMGFFAGEEEDGYWLYAHLVDDVIGFSYFAPYPPLADYHGDRAAVSALVGCLCGRLTKALGEKRLAELITAIASRCFLSGFVGFLSEEPLLAMWEELLLCRAEKAAFPRVTLHKWLAGVIRCSEECLLVMIRRATECEVVPIAFQKLQEIAQTRPKGWRPGVKLFPHQLQCLHTAFHNGREGFADKHDTQTQHEQHYEDVNATLSRTSNLMAEAMNYLQTLEGIGSQ